MNRLFMSKILIELSAHRNTKEPINVYPFMMSGGNEDLPLCHFLPLSLSFFLNYGWWGLDLVIELRGWAGQ